MVAVGLTGGIGSGKSTVGAALLSRGAVLVDADAIARSLQEPGMAVFESMVDRFGESIVGSDGRLDRQAVADIVFNNTEALEDLNRIVHPKVGEAIASALAVATADIVVLDIPLLVEGLLKTGKSNYEVAGILVVDCPVDVQVERLIAHRGFDADDARSRISNQATREERVSVADFVIDNSGPVDALAAQIDAAWQWMTNLHATETT